MAQKEPRLPQTWWLYVLECRGGVLYTGIAKDVAARFEAHVKGIGAMFTRLNRPIRILGKAAMATRGEALRVEYALKQLPRASKLSWCARGLESFVALDRLWHTSSATFQSGIPLATHSTEPTRKAQIDAVLLKLPGVSTKKINGLDAYFVNDRMFACISGNGVGLRLPVNTARDLQFSRDNVVPFQPAGIGATREWIQIDRAEAADYEKDLELFKASLEFVKASRTR